MTKEVPMQIDLFSGELIDNRTTTQKRKAKQEEGPKQAEMFSQRELAQFGVKANPKLPLSPKTRLELMVEDRRTEDEKEEARWRESLEKNYQMFPEPVPVTGQAQELQAGLSMGYLNEDDSTQSPALLGRKP